MLILQPSKAALVAEAALLVEALQNFALELSVVELVCPRSAAATPAR